QNRVRLVIDHKTNELMADNETDIQNEAISDQQQKPSTSESSLRTTTTVQNEEVEIRQKRNRWERTSSDRSRKIVGARENVLSGKFDFGDRDEKPIYNIILPPLKEDEGKEWTIDELKTLHDCINSYGINDNCLFHAAKNIPNRSMFDIREKISGIRELSRLRHEMRIEARKTEWLKRVTLPSKTSEIQDWSSAVRVIQNRKRRINDYTDSAL
ncbi:unnamed protein product, partial [Onchocerca ochengi]